MSLLKWAVVCGILALLFAILGFGGMAAAFAGVAKVLFFIFLVGVILLVIAGFAGYEKLTHHGPRY
jgi:uncharacterized membrane protein YtjA (UPF0391 family)